MTDSDAARALHAVEEFDPGLRIYHRVARCRWCGGRFYRIWAETGAPQWLCESEPCAARQYQHAEKRSRLVSGLPPYLYIPTPAQVELHECLTPNLLWGGAARGSKSHGLRWNAYKNCRRYPGYRVLLLRRTYPELEETHLQRMEADQGDLDAEYKGGQVRRLTFTNGSTIKAGHCQSKKDIEIYLSTEYDEIIFDEGSTFPEGAIREISARACATMLAVVDRGGAIVRIGSNPGGESALYLSERYITKDPDPDDDPYYDPSIYAFIQARVADNPYAPEDYTEIRLNTLTPTRQKQLRDGNWAVFGSQFFPTLDSERHVRTLNADRTRALLGIYWRFNDTGCAVLLRVFENGRLYVQRDYRFTQMTVAAVCAELRAIVQRAGAPWPLPAYGQESVAPPSDAPTRGIATDSIVRQFAREGIGLVPIFGDVGHGWQRMQDFLANGSDGDPMLIIAPECKLTIRTLSTLVKKDDSDDCEGRTYAAHAIRCAIASRPAPKPARRPDRFVPGTWGYELRHMLGAAPRRRVVGASMVKR